ncbi:hypothetical protein BaRGS_00026590 [Batillaria attramentaria]|uniref:Integrase core domain-containing protein n=2 Tax=Batillaria attramentaria TaxID=370345 RepID=A0ABD0JMV9_9CAEN
MLSAGVIQRGTKLLSFCRWSFIIHGGVDGFSRMIVYLRASDNNRVLGLFQEAQEKHGLPTRVRVDRGVDP